MGRISSSMRPESNFGLCSPTGCSFLPGLGACAVCSWWRHVAPATVRAIVTGAPGDAWWGNEEFVARPLLATKLYVPRTGPGLVVRRRLLERLDAGATARLTLLSAPPGFGKTTLLAEWARAASNPVKQVAWVSLDAGDTDPGSFWPYVVASLAALVPGLGEACEDLANAGRPAGPEAITTLLNELAGVAGDVWLVLDDYHLPVNNDVRDGVRFLLEHLPPQLHVLISTRVDPDLPLSRWRGRGELVELRAADLRFTRDEATEYLNAASGLELAATDADALGERTEGWIAALQLAALSLRGREDASGFIERFAGDDRYIVDYLMDEVLAHQPDDVRDFLLRTAVLARLTGGLCDAVTGGDGGAETLVRLERANLFVVPLDDQLAWFRYHHLFADVLRARLLAERPAEVPLLHRRASAWYEAGGFPDEAIGHALAAADFDRAGQLVEAALPEARRDRRDAALIGWLRALPEETIGRSPVLTTFAGWAALVAGDLDALEARLDHADALLATVEQGTRPPWLETAELRILPATIAMYRASLSQARGDLAGVVRHARRALEAAGPDDDFWRGGASGFLALAAWSEGDIATAVETFTTAVASLHSAGALVDALSSTALLAEMWTVAGRTDRAREVAGRALVASRSVGLPRRGRRPTCTSRWPSWTWTPATRPLLSSTSPRHSRSQRGNRTARAAPAGSSPLRVSPRLVAITRGHSGCSMRPRATTAPATTRTCARSQPCGRGYRSPPATWPALRTGLPKVVSPSPMRPATSGSTSTSRSSAWPWPGTLNAWTRRSPCFTGWRRRPSPQGGQEAWWRFGSCSFVLRSRPVAPSPVQAPRHSCPMP